MNLSPQNLIDLKKKLMFELILCECECDPDPVFKILICWIRIRPKMDRIRNPAINMNQQKKAKETFSLVVGIVGTLVQFFYSS